MSNRNAAAKAIETIFTNYARAYKNHKLRGGGFFGKPSLNIKNAANRFIELELGLRGNNQARRTAINALIGKGYNSNKITNQMIRNFLDGKNIPNYGSNNGRSNNGRSNNGTVSNNGTGNMGPKNMTKAFRNAYKNKYNENLPNGFLNQNPNIKNAIMRNGISNSILANIQKRIKGLVNSTTQTNRQLNNINKEFLKLTGKNNLPNNYNNKKKAVIKRRNNLPLWNTRRHEQNPAKLAQMIINYTNKASQTNNKPFNLGGWMGNRARNVSGFASNRVGNARRAGNAVGGWMGNRARNVSGFASNRVGNAKRAANAVGGWVGGLFSKKQNNRTNSGRPMLSTTNMSGRR